jgi:hypothetical protein
MMGYQGRRIPQRVYLYIPGSYSRMRTSDLFNSGQELGGLQPLSF